MEKYSSEKIEKHIRKNGPHEAATKIKVSQITDSRISGNRFSSTNRLPTELHRINRSTSNAENVNYSSISNDLIPYPASAISTIIQKGNNVEHRQSCQSENGTIGSAKSAKSSSPFDQQQQQQQQQHRQSSLSDAVSPKPGSVDNIADNVCTSQLSPKRRIPPTSAKTTKTTISFDIEHIVRVLAFLNARKDSGTQTEFEPERCNQYVQTSANKMAQTKSLHDDNSDGSRRFDLIRSNQTLRSQLDQLSYVIEQMSKERSATNLQIHSMQKQIKLSESSVEKMSAEKEKCIAQCDELRFATDNMKRLVEDYKQCLDLKAAEGDALRAQLAAAGNERNTLRSRVEQLNAELTSKESLIGELYRVNSVNHAEIDAMKEQLASGVEMRDHLLVAKSTQNETQQQQQQHSHSRANNNNDNTISEQNVCKKVKKCLQTNCALFRADLLDMKESIVRERDQSAAQFAARRDTILAQFAYLMRSTPQDAEFERLRGENERIKAQIAHTITTRDELMRTMQTKNDVLSQTNETFERRIVSLSEDGAKWKHECAQAYAVRDQCRGELDAARAQVDELRRRYEAEAKRNFDEHRRECDDLRASVIASNQAVESLEAKLEAAHADRRECITKAENQKLAEIEMLRSYLADRDDTIVRLESSLRQLTEKQEEQESKSLIRIDQVCQTTESDTMMEDSRILAMQNAITERDTFIAGQREQLSRLTNLCEQNDKIRSEMQATIDWLEGGLRQSETLLSTLQQQQQQQQQANEQRKNLSATLSIDNNDNKVDNNNSNPNDKTVGTAAAIIESLQQALTHEKERSKGLSQSLFNEKRLCSKLSKELAQAKQQQQPQQQQQQQSQQSNDIQPLSTSIDEHSNNNNNNNSELSNESIEQLNTNLRQRIVELRALLTQIGERRRNAELSERDERMTPMMNGDNEMMMPEDRSIDWLQNTLSSVVVAEELASDLPINDFIIKMLNSNASNTSIHSPQAEASGELTEEDGDMKKPSDKPPLGKLHSSIEDIKQELSNLKQSLVFDT